MPRLKAIGEWAIGILHPPSVGKQHFRHIFRVVAHQIVALHAEQLRVFSLRLAPPFFKPMAVDDIGRYARIEKGEHPFFIHQHIRAARFVFQFANFFH